MSSALSCVSFVFKVNKVGQGKMPAGISAALDSCIRRVCLVSRILTL